jgi:prepilin-type N-terminal cleavage/methylation domain-containing protein
MTREPRLKRERTLSTFHFPLSTRSGGFTLIEMLVVIVIIVILMGVVFKLSKGAMTKATYAKEVKRVAILRTLIEEYHAEYNLYPPVPAYTVNGKLTQPVNFTGTHPADGEAFDWFTDHYSVSGKQFTFGLMSFFVNRGTYCDRALAKAGPNNENIRPDWREYNDDPVYEPEGKAKIPAKDLAFVKRVKPIVDQIYDGDLNVVIDPEYPDQEHSMGFTTAIKDSWGREYVYISRPPYTTYLIFSPGPDGVYDVDNPGDRAADKNRDNIYGNLGDK